MILFAVFSVAYLLALLSIRPAPLSLKAEMPGFREHAVSIRISLLLGLVMLGVFLITSDFGFREAEPEIVDVYAMRGGWMLDGRSPVRALSHWLMHINLQHLLANVAVLGLLSVYECRVGARRFVAVLLVACLVSAFSAFYYPASTRICGISGGLFGLAAAYFVDERSMSTKDWLQAIVFFVAVIALLTIAGELHGSGANAVDFRIDHLGHFLGALGAVVYCRLHPLH